MIERALSQPYEPISEGQLGRPLFHLTVVTRLISLEDKWRCDAVVEINYDLIQFVRHPEGYLGEVEVILHIKDEKGVQVWREVKQKKALVRRFEETNDRRKFLWLLFSPFLPPGEYRVQVVVTDTESLQSYTQEMRFSVSVPNADLAVSGPLFSLSPDWDSTLVFPQDVAFRRLIGDSLGQIWAFFDVIAAKEDPWGKISLIVRSESGMIVFQDSSAHHFKEGYQTIVVLIPYSRIPYGEYQLQAEVFSQGRQVVKNSQLQVNHFGLPPTIRNLEEAIRQLKYIATESEIESLMRIFPSQREEAFLNFWNRNFPTPGERVNGKMIEYYSRIDYANHHFSSNRSGWETDRGKIYIIYGPPVSVERSGFNEQGSLEIWYYPHLGKRFVFRDEFGFGDFRLISPPW
ncbi:MAG: GWxTD domain-containing protein [bacterium]